MWPRILKIQKGHHLYIICLSRVIFGSKQKSKFILGTGDLEQQLQKELGNKDLSQSFF